MSANITIKEGGAGKILNAIKKLKISTGSGTSLWLPESDLALSEKSVTKNGTYKASDDGKYGYSEVTVNVTKKSSTSGKKPDGNDYNVERDPDGNIIETKLPSSIRLTTNPTKMTYNNGESIDMTGAVVKAYCGDGTLWEGDGYSGGVIPLSEIEIDPTTAQGSGSDGIWSDNNGINAKKFDPFLSEGNYYWYESDCGLSTPNQTNVSLYITLYEDKIFIAKGNGSLSGNIVFYDNNYGTVGILFNVTTNFSQKFSSDSLAKMQSLRNILPVSTRNPNGVSVSNLSTQNNTIITVSWERPKDDKELTTKFTVEVNSSSSGNNSGGSGGNNTGGGGGSW